MKYVLAVAILSLVTSNVFAQCGVSQQQQQQQPRSLASQADLAALARAAAQVAQPQTNLTAVAPRQQQVVQQRQQVVQQTQQRANLQIVDDMAGECANGTCPLQQQQQNLQIQQQQRQQQSRGTLPQPRQVQQQPRQDRFTQTYSVSRSSLMQFTGALMNGASENVASR